MSQIKKIWGTRQRILKTDKTEIDLLQLDADTACSIHSHKDKINRFILLEGDVTIRTNLGDKKLIVNEPFDVEPPLVHQFVVSKKSKMIELAFVHEGKIQDSDIDRLKQGGRIIKKKFYTMAELEERNWLKL